jgi:metal transporter CNNM
MQKRTAVAAGLSVVLILAITHSDTLNGLLPRGSASRLGIRSVRHPASATVTQQQQQQQDKVVLRRQGMYLLAAAGVSGLCHPSTNLYAPDFPQCDGGGGNEESATPLPPAEDFFSTFIKSSISSFSSASSSHRGLGGDNNNNQEQNEMEINYDDDDDDYFVQHHTTTNLTNEEIVAIVEEFLRPGWRELTISIVGATICVVLAGLASGLMYGILSLDPIMLLIKQRAGATERERRQAASLMPLVRQRHFLLVTLLLLSCCAGEALPVLINMVATEVTAVAISVALILIVGDILPSALFTGTNQVALASRLSPLLKLFMCLLSPIAWPMSKLLDWIFSDKHGSEAGKGLDRVELAALIRIQYEQKLSKDGHTHNVMHPSLLEEVLSSFFSKEEECSEVGTDEETEAKKKIESNMRQSSIHLNEVNIAEGALQMSTRYAIDIIKPKERVYSLPIDTILTEDNIVRIYSSGYSRVPIYEEGDKSRIRGILMTRQLIVVNKNDSMPVSRLPLHTPQCVGPQTNLVDLISLFQGHANRVGHMALVCANPIAGNLALDQNEALSADAGFMGILTLEDVLEAVLQEEIYDEMDVAGRNIKRVASSSSSDKIPHDGCNIAEGAGCYRLMPFS